MTKRLKYILIFSTLTLLFKVSYSNSQPFDKKAYFNLNTKNHYNFQSLAQKDKISPGFFKELLLTLSEPINNTDFNNINQFPNRVTNDLEDKSINKTQEVASQTNNKFANSTNKDKNDALFEASSGTSQPVDKKAYLNLNKESNYTPKTTTKKDEVKPSSFKKSLLTLNNPISNTDSNSINHLPDGIANNLENKTGRDDTNSINLVIRPQSLSISIYEDKNNIIINAGNINYSEFLGETVRYFVDINGHELIVDSIHQRDLDILKTGATVYLNTSINQISFLDAE